MNRCLISLLIILIPCIAFGQFGINARYLFGKSGIMSDGHLSQDGIHVSAEYHFRLQEKRVEFRPGAGYRYTFEGNLREGHLKAYDVDFGVAVYPFDFAGDCDCPTFSKEGNLVKKGFFLEVSPGMSLQTITRLETFPPHSELPLESENLIWKLGGAAGLDIGLTDRFTFTPMFSMTFLSSAEWAGLHRDGSAGILNDHFYYGIGARISYNKIDKKRRRRN